MGRYHMKLINQFVGKWRIVDMEVWDQEYVDMEVPGYRQAGTTSIVPGSTWICSSS